MTMTSNPTPTPLASTAMEAAREKSEYINGDQYVIEKFVAQLDPTLSAIIQKHFQPLLAKVEGEAAEAKRVIGGVRHENERLRGVERALRADLAAKEAALKIAQQEAGFIRDLISKPHKHVTVLDRHEIREAAIRITKSTP